MELEVDGFWKENRSDKISLGCGKSFNKKPNKLYLLDVADMKFHQVRNKENTTQYGEKIFVTGRPSAKK